MIIPQYRAGCPHVTHPSATKIDKNPAGALILNIFVRLACVKHAASVHPEPGSNSYVKVLFLPEVLAILRFFRNRQTLVILSATSSLLNWLWVVSLFLLFSFQGSVLFITHTVCGVSFFILSGLFHSVKYFFKYFSEIFESKFSDILFCFIVFLATPDYLTRLSFRRQVLF